MLGWLKQMIATNRLSTDKSNVFFPLAMSISYPKVPIG